MSATGTCAEAGGDRFDSLLRSYNEAAIDAYLTGDTKPLLAFATEKEAEKVRILVDIKRNNGLVLVSELQKLEILKTLLVSSTERAVRTKERWSYYDKPLKSELPKGKRFVADMTLTYVLKQEKGIWKVEKVKAEETTYIEGAPEKR